MNGAPWSILFRLGWIHRNGPRRCFQHAEVVDRQFAFRRIVDQLPGSRHDFICTPAYLERISAHIGEQGPVAFCLFLVVCVDANSCWLVLRPAGFALALCGNVRPLVIRAGAHRHGRQPRSSAGLPDSAGRRRIHLPAWRHENRQPAVRAERARIAVRTFRLRYPNGIGP